MMQYVRASTGKLFQTAGPLTACMSTMMMMMMMMMMSEACFTQ